MLVAVVQHQNCLEQLKKKLMYKKGAHNRTRKDFGVFFAVNKIQDEDTEDSEEDNIFAEETRTGSPRALSSRQRFKKKVQVRNSLLVNCKPFIQTVAE